ncbi:MAG: T9SS type A sorting domain-containing protein [Paludibacter sp.]|nr:T9SS type A sorting domain-containing protein [Paludibacter sp.]
MKKFTLFLVMLLSAMLANAQVLMDETFNYADFPNVSVVSSTVTGNGFTTTTGTALPTTELRSLVTTPVLNYTTGIDAYALSGVGKTLLNTYSGVTSGAYTSYKSFTASPITTGVVYLSFLFKVQAQGGSNAEIIGLSDAPATSGIKVWYGKNATNGSIFRFGITRSSTTSADIQWIGGATSTYYDAAATYFIVIKYDFSTSTASLFVNPIVGTTTEPAANAVDNSKGTAKTALSLFMIKCNGNNASYFYTSGVRVSLAWADAVAASSLPRTSAPANGVASSIGAEGFTANWTAVAGATGYNIFVYQGTNLISTYTANGQSAQSINIDGLTVNTPYSYSVSAIGDGTTVTNSIQSTASVFSTATDYPASLSTAFNDGSWGTAFLSTDVLPASGALPSMTANGFDVARGYLYADTKTGPRGEVHTNSIRLDKLSYTGMFVFPTVKTVGQIEIHVAPATGPRDFLLKQLISGVWTAVGAGSAGTVGTYTIPTSGVESIFMIPITANTTNAKFRIENGGTGYIYIYQVIIRTTNPALLATPTTGTAGNITATGFTANWTPVANVTGYFVKVYSGTTLVNTYTANGQTAQSLVISDLQGGTAYTYAVVAKGDGDNLFTDSYISTASSLVTTATQLTAPVLGTVSTIVSSGFTAVWTPVANAASYDVLVYNGATLIQTNNVMGQASASLDIIGLTSSATYTYAVVAKGDGITYFDSNPSALSNQITTLNTSLADLKLSGFVTAHGKTILCSEAGQIQVYNMQGAKVLQAFNANKLVTTLESGLYIVRFTSKDGLMKSAKVIIK